MGSGLSYAPGDIWTKPTSIVGSIPTIPKARPACLTTSFPWLPDPDSIPGLEPLAYRT